MNEPNPFDEIMKSYEITLDCLKITERTIKRNENSTYTLKNTEFTKLTTEQAKDQIDKSRENAKDYVIFQLWIVFERRVLAFCINESNKLLSDSATSFTEQFQQKIIKELEFWRFDDVLDLFKSLIHANTIGEAKQIKKYRDWLAHKNTTKPKPDTVDPKAAYKILSKIVKQLENHANNT